MRRATITDVLLLYNGQVNKVQFSLRLVRCGNYNVTNDTDKQFHTEVKFLNCSEILYALDRSGFSYIIFTLCFFIVVVGGGGFFCVEKNRIETKT